MCRIFFPFQLLAFKKGRKQGEADKKKAIGILGRRKKDGCQPTVTLAARVTACRHLPQPLNLGSRRVNQTRQMAALLELLNSLSCPICHTSCSIPHAAGKKLRCILFFSGANEDITMPTGSVVPETSDCVICHGFLATVTISERKSARRLVPLFRHHSTGAGRVRVRQRMDDPQNPGTLIAGALCCAPRCAHPFRRSLCGDHTPSQPLTRAVHTRPRSHRWHPPLPLSFTAPVHMYASPPASCA